jgi:hypothetical protein
MLRIVYSLTLVFFFSLCAPSFTQAQERTIGLIVNEDGTFDGYALFAPMAYTVTYLIDMEGLLVHTWESDYRPRFAVQLLEDGSLVRASKPGINPVFIGGGAGGLIERISWEGSLDWEFEYSSDQYLLHHDFEVLPGGNILMIAWEYKSAEEAIEAGRDPASMSDDELWPDHIIEVEPQGQAGGNIVWEWHIWDHLIQDFDSTKANYGVVADHPELMDINFYYNRQPDWNHINSVDYNEEFDQILLSLHHPSEIIIIDHSTTTEEAAGHSGGTYGRGGDFLYRWGNQQVYRAGDEQDRKLFRQHDARWIEAGLPGEGNILIFNNGGGRPDGSYSSVEEIEPPVDSEGYYFLEPGSAYGPEEPAWQYMTENPEDFFSANLSGAHRLPNGNTMICKGQGGEFSEVTPEGELLWLYINPVNMNGPMDQGDEPENNNVFRVHRYSPDFPGFDGRDMTPGDPIERYPTDLAEGIDEIPSSFAVHANYPNPFNAATAIEYDLPRPMFVTVEIYDLLGRRIERLVDGFQQAGPHTVVWDAERAATGVYFYRILAGEYDLTRKMVLLK